MRRAWLGASRAARPLGALRARPWPATSLAARPHRGGAPALARLAAPRAPRAPARALSWPAGAPASTLDDELVGLRGRRLLSACEAHLSDFEPRHFVAVLEQLGASAAAAERAALAESLPFAELRDRLRQRLEEEGGAGFTLEQLCALLYALVRVGPRAVPAMPGDDAQQLRRLYSTITRLLEARLRTAPAGRTAAADAGGSAAHAPAALDDGPPPPPPGSTAARARALGAARIVNLAWASSIVSHAAPGLLDALAPLASDVCGEFTPSQMATVVWAYRVQASMALEAARAQRSPGGDGDGDGDDDDDDDDEPTDAPRGAADCLRAAMPRAAPLLEVLAGALCARAAELSTPALAVSIEALSALRVQRAHMCEALGAAFAARVRTVTDAELQQVPRLILKAGVRSEVVCEAAARELLARCAPPPDGDTEGDAPRESAQPQHAVAVGGGGDGGAGDGAAAAAHAQATERRGASAAPPPPPAELCINVLDTYTRAVRAGPTAVALCAALRAPVLQAVRARVVPTAALVRLLRALSVCRVNARELLRATTAQLAERLAAARAPPPAGHTVHTHLLIVAVQACAKFGLHAPDLVDEIVAHARERAHSMPAVELVTLTWSLAILGQQRRRRRRPWHAADASSAHAEHAPSDFSFFYSALVRRYATLPLDMRLDPEFSTKVGQAMLTARLQGCGSGAPPRAAGAAGAEGADDAAVYAQYVQDAARVRHLLLRQLEGVHVSWGQRRLSAQLRRAGWAHEVELPIESGLLMADMASAARREVVEFDGPHHFLVDPDTGGAELGGSDLWKMRQLERLGWAVVRARHSDWAGLRSHAQRRAYAARLLDELAARRSELGIGVATVGLAPAGSPQPQLSASGPGGGVAAPGAAGQAAPRGRRRRLDATSASPPPRGQQRRRTGRRGVEWGGETVA